jgi:hypothetical protein
MVISDELKFPRPVRVDPYHTERKVEPIEGLVPVAPIGAFKRDWQRGREKQREQGQSLFSSPEETSVRRLVAQVNNHLKDRKIPIHLVLIKDEHGYTLDVYDCTGTEQCTIIGDVEIDLDDLPVLLKNLQEETGLLLDTIS